MEMGGCWDEKQESVGIPLAFLFSKKGGVLCPQCRVLVKTDRLNQDSIDLDFTPTAFRSSAECSRLQTFPRRSFPLRRTMRKDIPELWEVKRRHTLAIQTQPVSVTSESSSSARGFFIGSISDRESWLLHASRFQRVGAKEGCCVSRKKSRRRFRAGRDGGGENTRTRRNEAVARGCYPFTLLPPWREMLAPFEPAPGPIFS